MEDLLFLREVEDMLMHYPENDWSVLVRQAVRYGAMVLADELNFKTTSVFDLRKHVGRRLIRWLHEQKICQSAEKEAQNNKIAF